MAAGQLWEPTKRASPSPTTSLDQSLNSRFSRAVLGRWVWAIVPGLPPSHPLETSRLHRYSSRFSDGRARMDALAPPYGSRLGAVGKGGQSLLEKAALTAHQTPKLPASSPHHWGTQGAHKCSHQTSVFMIPAAAVRPGVTWPLCGSRNPALRRKWGRFNPFWDLSMGREAPGAQSSRSFKFTPQGPPFLYSLFVAQPHTRGSLGSRSCRSE